MTNPSGTGLWYRPYIFHIIKDRVITVCDDASTHLLELVNIIDHPAAEESASVLQGRLVDYNRCTLGFDSLHNTLDRGLAEIIAAHLHGETVYTDYNIILLRFPGRRVGLAVSVRTCDLQHPVCDEVLPGLVALYDRLDQILRHIPVIGVSSLDRIPR